MLEMLIIIRQVGDLGEEFCALKMLRMSVKYTTSYSNQMTRDRLANYATALIHFSSI